jgi:hypothetical protein
MDILDALSKSLPTPPKEETRVMVDDGLLSVSYAVFEVKMRALGFDKEEIDEWMKEPPELRHHFIKRWDKNEGYSD